jgi:Golgi phosphoprotein 3 GPP34
MLIAEDRLFLPTDETTGKLSFPASKVDLGLGGALVVELTVANRVGSALRVGNGGE